MWEPSLLLANTNAWVHFFFGTALFLVSLFLILLVLVQRGKGGGLAGALGGQGGQSAFGTKAGDTFTRVTIGVALVWMALCIATIFTVAERPASKLTNKGKPGAPGAKTDEPLLPEDGKSEGEKPGVMAKDAVEKTEGEKKAEPEAEKKTEPAPTGEKSEPKKEEPKAEEKTTPAEPKVDIKTEEPKPETKAEEPKPETKTETKPEEPKTTEPAKTETAPEKPAEEKK